MNGDLVFFSIKRLQKVPMENMAYLRKVKVKWSTVRFDVVTVETPYGHVGWYIRFGGRHSLSLRHGKNILDFLPGFIENEAVKSE